MIFCFLTSYLLLFHFQISPRQPQTRVFSTNKQSVYTLMYRPYSTSRFPVFSKDSRHVAFNPFFASLFSFVGFNSPKPFLPFQLLIHIWLTAFLTSNNIYIMVVCIFCVQIFCNIDCLCLCMSLQFVTSLFLLPSCSHTAH